MNNFDQLKSGDILIFKAGDNWISKSIALLTNSDVSHAAMMLDNETLVEMGSNGICNSKVKISDGNNAILMRISPEKDPLPLVNSLNKYIDCETRYDFPALVFLAGLIIYRKVRPTTKFVTITDIILKKACKLLDKLIQSIVLKNPDKAMVCSQLVYQVYLDCGKDYHIKIQDGLLQLDKESQDIDDKICLVDFVSCEAPIKETNLVSSAYLLSEDDIAKELYLALSEENQTNDTLLSTGDLGALPFQINVFLEKLEEFLAKTKNNLPLNALFVTPADLAYKSTNLRTVGKLNIDRLK